MISVGRRSSGRWRRARPALVCDRARARVYGGGLANLPPESSDRDEPHARRPRPSHRSDDNGRDLLTRAGARHRRATRPAPNGASLLEGAGPNWASPGEQLRAGDERSATAIGPLASSPVWLSPAGALESTVAGVCDANPLARRLQDVRAPPRPDSGIKTRRRVQEGGQKGKKLVLSRRVSVSVRNAPRDVKEGEGERWSSKV